MKRIIFSFIISVTLAAAVSAQSLHIGLKLGANLGKIDGQSFKDEYNLGYQAGAFVELGLSKSIAVQPELLFSQTNTKVDSGYRFYKPGAIIGSHAHLNYLSIPILLNINAGKFLTLQLGPQFSIKTNKDETLVDNGKDAVKNGDLSAVLGAQIYVGALKIYGRYNIGLNNINDIDNHDKWTTQVLSLGLGFKIL